MLLIAPTPFKASSLEISFFLPKLSGSEDGYEKASHRTEFRNGKSKPCTSLYLNGALILYLSSYALMHDAMLDSSMPESTRSFVKSSVTGLNPLFSQSKTTMQPSSLTPKFFGCASL